MTWRLVETCCGSAALTMHLLGATGHQIVPFQGSKHRLRRQLAQHLRAAGFEGAPSAIELSDPSYWGTAHADILSPGQRGLVIAELERLDKLDPREVYDGLHGAGSSEAPGVATAQFLFLQRLAFSGKAVGTKGGRWKAQGFNKTNAYGNAKTERFGAIKPLIASLIRTLGKLDLAPVEYMVRRGVARPPDSFQWRTVTYIDPPYSGTTGYPDGDMPRAEVINLARAWRSAGAFVMVSEAEPLRELTDTGWNSTRLQKRKERDKSKFKGKQEEWLTCSRAAA